MNTKFP